MFFSFNRDKYKNIINLPKLSPIKPQNHPLKGIFFHTNILIKIRKKKSIKSTKSRYKYGYNKNSRFRY